MLLLKLMVMQFMNKYEPKIKDKIWFSPIDLSRGNAQEFIIEKVRKKYIIASGLMFERHCNGYAIGFKMASPEGYIYPSKAIYESKLAWDQFVSNQDKIEIEFRNYILSKYNTYLSNKNDME